MKQAALSWLKLPVRFPARNDSNGRGLSICLQCGLFAFRIRKGFAYLIQKALLNYSSTASVSSTTECPSQALAIVWKFALPHSSIIGASIPCLCSHCCWKSSLWSSVKSQKWKVSSHCRDGKLLFNHLFKRYAPKLSLSGSYLAKPRFLLNSSFFLSLYARNRTHSTSNFMGWAYLL